MTSASTATDGQTFPLSFTQERLWFLDQLEPGLPVYNVPEAFRLKGLLIPSALERAVNEIIRRHDSLRTTFAEVDGRPSQIVAPRLTLNMEVHDLTQLGPTEREHEAARRVNENVNRPFDLAHGPLVRVSLFRLAHDEHVLLINMHHIVSEGGWSMALFRRELNALYNSFVRREPSPLPELDIQYGDYAVWQRDWLQGGVLDEMLAYWKQQLQGAPGLLELPTDQPRPATQSYSGGRESLLLPASLKTALQKLGAGESATPFMTLLAAFQALLFRYTGQEDLCVGAPVAGRNSPETHDLIGFFVNTLVLRTDLSGDPTFRQLLQRVREAGSQALTHDELPFELLVEALNPDRTLAYSPLFQVMFAYQNVPHEPLALAGLTASTFDFEICTSMFDLRLFLWEQPDGIQLTLEYSTALFDPATIQRFLAHYRTLLEGAAAEPDQNISRIPLLSAAERDQVLHAWNKTEEYPSSLCIHELFEEQVRKTPSAAALVFENASLTYAELNARANRLAHYLHALGVQPDARVGICLERSLEMVVALLAVLKAGGAYLPLDPAYPADRLRYMLDDSSPVALLTQASLMPLFDRLSESVPVLDLASEAPPWKDQPQTDLDPAGVGLTPHRVAYVIYTSGSTGKPKGVMVEHANVSRLFTATEAWFHFGESDVWTLFHSFAFDFSVWEIWGALFYGGCLVVVPKDVARSPEDFYKLVCARNVTVLNQTPSAFRQFIAAQADSADRHRLRYVIFGGEALEVASLKPWYEQNPAGPQLVNMYGITETTVHVTYRPLDVADTIRRSGASPIGCRIPDLRTYILDRNRQPVPIGVTGELYVGGAGVARGYLNRPELTAERFLPDPFAGGDQRMYKTGDLARWLPGGAMEFLGRNDNQVKIRGFRIEIGEIESRLAEHSTVRDAVVLARQDAAGDKRLVAYYTTRTAHQPLPAEELRAHLSKNLPDYMVPAAYVCLESLPLTANGKLDQRALPAPDAGSYAAHGYEAPVGEIETALAAIWADVLNIDRVGRQDDFFQLGGHSLLAVRLIERMRRNGFPVDVRALFATPTLAGLAAAVNRDDAGIEVPPNRIPANCTAITPAMLPLVELTPQEIAQVVSMVAGGAANVQDIYPLAPLQEGILFHHLMSEKGDPYLLATLLAFESREVVQRYLDAMRTVIARHDILRTSVVWDGLPEPAQVVWRQADLPVEEVALDPAAGDVAQQLCDRFSPSHYKIDLRRAPLLRILLAYDPVHNRWLMLQLLHHLMNDVTTLRLMQSEMEALLLRRPDRLPVPLPFRNFVAQARSSVHQREHEAFFRSLLGNVDEPTAPFGLLDVLGNADAIQESRFTLDRALSRRIRQQARRLSVSPATLYHLAWALVLARVSGRDDVVFGTVLFGRMQGGEGADRVLGPFINTLPARIHIGGEDVEAGVRQTHALVASLLRHEHASLTLAQRSSAVALPLPLFSSLLNYRHSVRVLHLFSEEETARAWDGIHSLHTEDRTNYPFTLSVDDEGDGFQLTAQVEAPADAVRVCGFVRTALESLVTALETSPGMAVRDLAVLPGAERRTLLAEWNATNASYPADTPLHELIEAQARQQPQHTAVVHQHHSLTYRELNTRANQLAAHLRSLGVAPGVLVGVCLPRSVDLIVALLAVMKAGGAYIPIDPDYPADRISLLLEDSQLQILLAEQDLRHSLPAFGGTILSLDWKELGRYSSDNLAVTVGPRDLAYVLYTSGSTGRPKGVLVSRGALLNLLWSMRSWYDLTFKDVFLGVTTISFDIAGVDVWLPLLLGSRLVLADRSAAVDGAELNRLLERHHVTFLQATPVTWKLLLAAGWHGKSDLKAVCTGEAMPADLARDLFPLVPNLWNMYGPTETTIWSTGFKLPSADAPVLIGRPIANTQLYILDANLSPVPIGVPGELYIGGDGLADGYLGRPDLTAQRFVPNPFATPPARLYRTGDLARYRDDGNVECLGRNDDQIKLRGFRIEPEEIRSVLMQYPSVSDAVAVLKTAESGEGLLVAYVCSEGAQDSLALRSFLERRLPSYMVPSAFVFLERMPLTPNGKIDRRALPAPDATDAALREYAAPRNNYEARLAKIWEDVLKVSPVGVYDNYFDLGGHSLLAVRLFSEIRRGFGIELPLATLYSAPTVESLAAVLAKNGEAALWSALVPIRRQGSKPPMYFVSGVGGGVLVFRDLAMHLGEDQPVYALQPKRPAENESYPTSIQEMAAHYIQEILVEQPQGPYYIGGYSLGGYIAFEMAQQLTRAGHEVAFLAVFDANAPLRVMTSHLALIPQRQIGSRRARLVQLVRSNDLWGVIHKRFQARRVWLSEKVARSLRRPMPAELLTLEGSQAFAGRNYVARSFPGSLTLFRSASRPADEPWSYQLGWENIVSGGVEVHEVPGDHLTIYSGSSLGVLAGQLKACLERAQSSRRAPLPQQPESAEALESVSR